MSTSENKCPFCNSIQTSKSNLDKHQKTSKTCIKIQEAKGVFNNKIPTCMYCKKECNILRLAEHEEVCVLKSVPSKGNSNITVDNSTVRDITSNIDNSINISINLDFTKFFTDEKIGEIFQEYKSEHALEQMKGLAKFIVEKILLLDDSPGYFVNDEKRNVYSYESDKGLEIDKNGEVLRKKIKDGASDHINKLVEQLIAQYSVMTGKKNEVKVEDMQIFKKDIKELHIAPKLVNCIKKSYTCKNKEERNERIEGIKDSQEKITAKKIEAENQKKKETERLRKIKNYKFNLDKDRPNTVLSKNKNEPLEYSDKPFLEELGLEYKDFFLEDLTV
jgi:hypothetical protein